MKILESIFFGQLSGETLNNKYSSTLLSIEEDIWSKFSVAALSVEEKEKLYKAIDYNESVRVKYPTEVMLLWCFIISLHPLYVSNYCIPHLLYFQYAPLLFASSAPLPVSLSWFFSPHPLSLWYSSSQPIFSPRYLPYPCFFTITTSSYTMSYLLFHPSFFSSPPSPFLSPPCSSSSSSSTPSPLPAPPPTSSLITSYKFLPLSFIFSTPSPPPTTSYPFSYSSFPFYSFFFLLVPPFFFSHLSSFPFSHLSSLFPLSPLLLFPPPFVVSILVSLFDPSIFETGNDLVIYVRRNRKETWKIITNFEKYMYVLMFTFFTHVTLLDGLQFIKSRITFNLDRCTFELLDATNWWVTLLSLLDQYTFSLVNCLQPVVPFVMSCFISVK